MERLDKDDLKNYFNDGKVIFFARLYECDLVNILQSIVLELSDIVIGAMEIYNKRVEDRLFCKLCNYFRYLDIEDGPTLMHHPFQCYHYYYTERLKHWKYFSLEYKKG